MVLSERRVLAVEAEYVVAIIDNNTVATLELNLTVHNVPNNIGESLQHFELVLCHLQGHALAVARRSRSSRSKAWNAQLGAAARSSCHVVGCRLHSWQADEVLGPKRKLHLPDVFESLMAHMEAEQSEIRDDVILQPRRKDAIVKIVDLPRNSLHMIVHLMEPHELAMLSDVCSLFRHLAYEVVPGLNLCWRTSAVAIDVVDRKVVRDVDTTTRDLCGGMFCDGPGLGKTITMLALILRTKGVSTRNAKARAELANEDAANTDVRSLRPRNRTVAVEDLVSSGASLIVVPDPLVEHWKYQIEAHVQTGALKTFIDVTRKDLPRNVDLAAYDVVIISFSRLAREWRLHRPVSAQEKRMPERYGFEKIKRYSDGALQGEVSSILTVHWVRVIVDEGHKLGGQTPTNFMQMARLISADRRWVMTGTPTPSTLQSADLRFMHGLLVFLRIKPYGQLDGRAWTKAIAEPFEQNKPIGFYRLQSLLSRILMRHTKDSIREILPEPVRHMVYIDPTPSEYAQYNVVATAVRANLVITNVDPAVPGKLHLDSLLNPINRKEALQVVSNLRFACCGGVNTEIVLSTKAKLETINMLAELDVDGDNIASVLEYLEKVTKPGMTTECGKCKHKLQLLMVLPCGHLCCADCLEDRFNRIGPNCHTCNEVYDPEGFQELQPGFEFREMGEQSDSQPQQLPAMQEIASNEPRRNRHYWMVDASKIFYAAMRVRELKREIAHAIEAGGHQRARYVKVIIFSQFAEMIWRTKLAFKQQNIPTADFITHVAPKKRMKALKRFREDPKLNVLLLSEMGSHGLDLSFVTHVFLMEEIWDKSLEQQVISRAHRMGAEQAVVVEKLWMRGSVESEMANVNELSENDYIPPRTVHDLGPPARKLKRKHTPSDGLLDVAGNKKRKCDHSDEAKVPENKSCFLQRKLDYVLNHLKIHNESVVAAPRQVRFSVVDEKNGSIIRQAIHTMPSPKDPAILSESTPSQPPDRVQSTTANRMITGTTSRSVDSIRRAYNGEVDAGVETINSRGEISTQQQQIAPRRPAVIHPANCKDGCFAKYMYYEQLASRSAHSILNASTGTKHTANSQLERDGSSTAKPSARATHTSKQQSTRALASTAKNSATRTIKSEKGEFSAENTSRYANGAGPASPSGSSSHSVAAMKQEQDVPSTTCTTTSDHYLGTSQMTKTQSNCFAAWTARSSTTTAPVAKIKSEKRAIDLQPVSASQASMRSVVASKQSSAFCKRRSRPPSPDPRDVILIDDEPLEVPPQPPVSIATVRSTNSGPEIIVIDGSSSSETGVSPSTSEQGSDSDASSCSADNEDHFGSDDSDSDSDESDAESQALFSRMINVAQQHIARYREASDSRAAATAAASPPVEVSAPDPEFDDESTETE
ncbi:unnamed protein product [Phytophthora fragariaefolia]|uniref:Unnamed protein product n=1 Tax=Phytophthora fragariaefolia TaxID=1490495 RepID=A0A9W6XW11_9STRA|nr:unnamed protein product [Phytophthora fragariaefolia]